jgi:4-hydroxybenzoyl-CoA thioesterase
MLGFVLVDVQANFIKPAAFGETVELVSRVADFRRSSFDVEHRLSRGEDVLVEGRETRVWAMPHATEPGRMTAGAIPQEVVAKFG